MVLCLVDERTITVLVVVLERLETFLAQPLDSLLFLLLDVPMHPGDHVTEPPGPVIRGMIRTDQFPAMIADPTDVLNVLVLAVSFPLVALMPLRFLCRPGVTQRKVPESPELCPFGGQQRHRVHIPDHVLSQDLLLLPQPQRAELVESSDLSARDRLTLESDRPSVVRELLMSDSRDWFGAHEV
jgi:hypothetical protein